MAWKTGWAYRVPITIDHTKVSAAATNYPLYVSEANLPSRFWDECQGRDLAFTLSDGTTAMPRDFVGWQKATTLEAHVLMPTISNITDDVLYMYWGNPSCADQQNAAPVWTPTYLAVWHLTQNAAGSYPDACGVYTGTDSVSPGAKVGKLLSYGGETFDGTGDVIGLDAALPVALSGLGAVTISFWFKRAVIATQQFPFYLVHDGAGSLKLYCEFRATTNLLRVGARPDLGGTLRVYDTSAAITDTASWHKADLVVNIASDAIAIYIDGSVVAGAGTTTWTPTSFDANGGASGLGGRADGTLSFNGLLDEVRLASSALAAERLATEYANHNALGIFYSVGAVEQNVNRAFRVPF